MSKTCTDASSIYYDIPNCRGEKNLPGMKAYVYGISKRDILTYPALPDSPTDLETAVTYDGNFTVSADKTFFYVGLIDDKNQLQVENQGEEYSKTFQVTATLDIPGIGKKVSGLIYQMNNDDMLFIVVGRDGAARVIGNEDFHVTLTQSQDSGQAVTDSNHTAVTAVVTDIAPAPFYVGTIPTEDGTLDCSTGEITETEAA